MIVGAYWDSQFKVCWIVKRFFEDNCRKSNKTGVRCSGMLHPYLRSKIFFFYVFLFSVLGELKEVCLLVAKTLWWIPLAAQQLNCFSIIITLLYTIDLKNTYPVWSCNVGQLSGIFEWIWTLLQQPLAPQEYGCSLCSLLVFYTYVTFRPRLRVVSPCHLSKKICEKYKELSEMEMLFARI